MSDHDAILEALTIVSRELGELRGEVKGVHERLDKINGRVGKNEDKVNDVLLRQATRTESCPLVEVLSKEIQPLRDYVTTNTAKSATNKEWWEHLAPFGYGLLMVILGLSLGHSEMVSKFLGK